MSQPTATAVVRAAERLFCAGSLTPSATIRESMPWCAASAVMQDGLSASLTAPNGQAQEALLRAAVADAGISAADVRLIEAHGTGTKLGDPVETEAIAAVYGEGRSTDNPLFVTGVKANMGHLEPAAGMAGLFSAILALQHAQAPPNAQLRSLNEKVAAAVAGHAMHFPTELSGLRASPAEALYAAVSSFGYSGTISHVVLGEAPPSSSRVVLRSTEDSGDASACYGSRYPLHVRTHRLLQSLDQEAYSAKTVFAAHFHPGIMQSWLGDYSVRDRVLCPTTAVMEMMCAAAYRERGLWASHSALRKQVSRSAVCLKNFALHTVIDSSKMVRCAIGDDGAVEVFHTDEDGSRSMCATANVALVGDSSSLDWAAVALQAKSTEPQLEGTAVDVGDEFYGRMSAAGVSYGPEFRSLRKVRMGSSSCIAQMALEEDDDKKCSYLLPPTIMEAMIQSALLLHSHKLPVGQTPFFATAVEDMWVQSGSIHTLWQHDTCEVHATMHEAVEGRATFDLALLTADGKPVVFMKGVQTVVIGADFVIPGSSVDAKVQALTSSWVVADAAASVASSAGLAVKAYSNCLVVGNEDLCKAATASLPGWGRNA